MIDIAKLTAIFNAKDRLSKGIKGMQKNTNGLNKTFKRLATAGAVAFSGIAVKKFVSNSVSQFGNFEASMKEVFTLLPGIQGDAMSEMEQQVLKFSKDFSVLPEKVVPALYQSLSAGVPQDNVFEFLAVAQKSAVGGIAELETAVDGISTVTNTYGSDIISAAEASDIMFTTVRLGKTTFGELSKSLFNVLPSANAAGISFEQVSASIAALTAQGVPTSVATTKIRSAIDEMSKAGTKTSKVFKEITGKTFKQFIAGGGNLQQAFQKLEKRANNTGIGINDLFGSVEAGSAALALTGRGTESFTNALSQMQESAGATDEAYKVMDTGINRVFQRMKVNFSVAAVELGNSLAPTVDKFANDFIAFMPKIEKFAQTAFQTIAEAIDIGVIKFGEIGDSVKSIVQKVFPDLNLESINVKDTILDLVEGGLNLLIGTFKFMDENIGFVKFSLGLLATGYGLYTTAVIAANIAQIAHNLSMGAAAIASGIQTGAIIALYTAEFLAAGATAGLSAAQAALNLILTANPIGLVVVAIGALIAGLVAAYKNSETFRNVINKLFQGIKTGASFAIDFFIGRLNKMIGFINKAITASNELFGTEFKTINLVQTLEEKRIQAAKPQLGPERPNPTNEQLGFSSSLRNPLRENDSRNELLNVGTPAMSSEDNRQFTINLNDQTIQSQQDPEEFKTMVMKVIDDSLNDEITTGGEFAYEP